MKYLQKLIERAQVKTLKAPTKPRSSAANRWGIYGRPDDERREYMREAKRRSRDAIRQFDPLYDRSRDRSNPRAIARKLPKYQVSDD